MINMNKPSWCVLYRSYMLVAFVMLCMTTLLVLNKSYPINLVMFGGTNHADYCIRDITGMNLRLPDDEPRPVDLCKGSRYRKYIKNANENNRNQRLNYTYQTHLVEDILSSNNPMTKYINLDIPRIFNKSFVNPCWYEPQEGHSRKLKCLPYFFLAGFPKSGTTDLFYKMGMHPEIKLAGIKEQHFWTRRRFPASSAHAAVKSLEYYKSKFDVGAACMQRIADLGLPGSVRIVTGDGSASTFWDNRHWKMLPGNDDVDEPRVIVADHIKHYLPASKIIVIMRDPVERLFSDYLYFLKKTQKPSADDFHRRVTDAITVVSDCLRHHPVRACVYSTLNIQVRLMIGMYSVYLRDWYRIFPRHQMHVLRTEDYSKSSEKELGKIFQFLELDTPPASLYEYIRNIPKANSQSFKKASISMQTQTRAALREFYAPFNSELSILLNNTLYQWRD